MPLDQVDADELYPDDKSMGFFDHLDELRARLVKIAYILIVATIICFVFVEDIFNLIVMSPFEPGFWGYEFFCKAGRLFTNSDALCWTPPKLSMQSQQIQGQFVSAFKISFVVGAIASFPMVVWQLWAFVRPALNLKEVKRVQRSLFVVSLLFFTGVAFAYFLLVPVATNFLLTYSLNENIQNIITISSVTGFVSFMSLATGLVFELPVLIYILASIGLVTSDLLKKYWRYAAVIIFIIAGIATPSPDMFSQLLLGLPLMSLYVVGIQIAKRVEKRKAQD
ncbi:MAG: twin-arginine translocase subunit TatC [Bacteroidia bacterium]|nr:twin-arginine translocase subunit TatC [Bacteroidia bacterium]